MVSLGKPCAIVTMAIGIRTYQQQEMSEQTFPQQCDRRVGRPTLLYRALVVHLRMIHLHFTAFHHRHGQRQWISIGKGQREGKLFTGHQRCVQVF